MTTRLMTRALLASLVGVACGLAVTCTVVLLGGRAGGGGDDDVGRAVGGTAVVGAELVRRASDPREVLRRWDAARAAAWTSGDSEGLAALYTPGSVAGRRDLARLRAWNTRGARVTAMTTQVLAVRVLVDEERRLVLRVTDRLVGAEAGAVTLPRDEVSTRIIALRRLGDQRWRVASVIDRPAPS